MKSWPLFIRLPAILLSVVLIFYVLDVAKSILIPLTLSILIALTLSDFSNRLEKHNINRVFSTVISLVTLILVSGSIFAFIVWELVKFSSEIASIDVSINQLKREATNFIENKFGIDLSDNFQDNIIEKLATLVTDGFNFILGNALSVTSTTLTFLGLVPVFIFFLLFYRSFFMNFLLMFFPSEKHFYIHKIIKDVIGVAKGYVLGLGLVTGIIIVLNTVSLLLIGVDNAIFLGFFSGILTIIPFIGVYIGGLFVALYTIATGSLLKAGLVIGAFTVIQYFEGDFITPKVIGSRVDINPFAGIIFLFLGGELWGALGLILAIPVMGMVKVIFDNIESLKPFGYILGTKKDCK